MHRSQFNIIRPSIVNEEKLSYLKNKAMRRDARSEAENFCKGLNEPVPLFIFLLSSHRKKF